MDSDLRRRSGKSTMPVEMPTSATGLCAPRMLQSSPQHSGELLKLHTSAFYSILPVFVQKLFAWCLSFLKPVWKERYGIILGSFFYKFKDAKSASPKGSPVPLESIEAHLVTADQSSAMNFPELPAGCTIFVVSMLRKRSYYATYTREEALLWVNTLSDAKHEATRRSLGHAPKDSFPKAWSYYDSLGRSLTKSKDRVRARVEEMEMKALSEQSHVISGFYG